MAALLPDRSLLRFSGRSFLGIKTQQNKSKRRNQTQQNYAKRRNQTQQNDSKWRKEFSKCNHSKRQYKGDGVDENQNEMDRKWRKETISSEDRTMCNSSLYSSLYFPLSHRCNCVLHVTGLKFKRLLEVEIYTWWVKWGKGGMK